MKKFNRTRLVWNSVLIMFQFILTYDCSFVFDGKYDLKVPLDDDIDMKIEAFNFQGGQYKKIGEKRFDKFCASVYDDMTEKQFAKFYAASTLKVPFGTCPFPAGESEITNLMVDDDGILPPYIPGGEKWRADVRFLKKTKILGGFNVYALIRNEQSLLKGG